MFSKLIRTLVILGGGAGRLGGGFSPPPNDLITNVSKFSRHLLVCHVVQSDYMCPGGGALDLILTGVCDLDSKYRKWTLEIA